MPKKQPKIVTLILDYPFEIAGEQVKKFEIKRPTGKDISNLGTEPKIGDLIDIGLQCAGHPPSVAGLMDATDAIKLTEIVGNFLADGQKTGDTAK